jgi:phosphomannomutase
MSEIFRAYDIRGIYPKEINEETAYKIGRAVVVFLKADKVVIGRDARITSDVLFKAISQGINDQGADVYDIGMSTTPMLYYANQNYPAGIMITASHNPKDYNGFKICREQAIPISGDTGIMDIKALVEKNKFPDAKKKGKIVKIDVVNDYLKFVLKFAGMKTKLKVVVDASNGAAGPTAKQIFDKLNCDYVPMYFEPDGRFPNHEPNQLKDENYKDLIASVKKNKADLGIMFDGDADRAGFVDEKGNIISLDLITALIGTNLLKSHPKEKVLFEVRSSWTTKEEIEKHGGIPILSRAGHAFIRTRMRDENAIFGGEKSGHFFFRDNFFADSAIIAAIAVMNEISASGKKFSEIMKPLQRYSNSGEINSEVENPAEIIKKVEQHYKEGKKMHVDGLTVEFKDWWFNLRMSQTEPLIRLNLEAKTKKLLDEKVKEVLALVRE